MTSYQRTWETRRKRGRSVADEARASYYGVPVIHKPHWNWLIILYFFLGGIAGASYAIASIADVFGRQEGQRIARAGRYISLATLLPSPVLLILDLGRRERFHHMLRVVKLRSPMSVGTWALTIFGAFCTLSALVQAAHDGLLGAETAPARLLRVLPAGLIGLVGAVPGFFVSGYTGVLLVATAVPLWTRSFPLMGPLFVASSVSNATATISLVLARAGGTSDGTRRRLERLECLALLAELALLLALPRRLGRVIARPMVEGRLGRIYRVGVLSLLTPLLLQLRGAWLGGTTSRRVSALASSLALAGGLMLRYVIVTAGRASADDPAAAFEMTKRTADAKGVQEGDFRASQEGYGRL